MSPLFQLHALRGSVHDVSLHFLVLSGPLGDYPPPPFRHPPITIALIRGFREDRQAVRKKEELQYFEKKKRFNRLFEVLDLF
jgi:hypothetical protein